MKKSIFNIIYRISFLCLVLGMNNLQASSKTCSEKDTQYFVLIHGIGGSQNDFGAMLDTIEAHVPCARGYFFNYATMNSKLTTHDFAKSLNLFLETLPPKNKKDINLIMHSQGGLVGLKWMVNSIHELEGFSKHIVERVNRFITLSTPFWGSDFAMLGKEILFTGLSSNFISPFGKKQLEQMQYGSPVYIDMVHSLTQGGNGAVSKFLSREVKMLNISGMAPYFNMLMHNVGGSQKFEGDYVVNTPSMQVNFNYAELGNILYESKKQENAATKSFDISNQSYAFGTHLDFFSLIGGTYGIVDVPVECIQLSVCDHPGYNTLFKFIQSGEVVSDLEIAKVIQGFELHVELNFNGDISEPQDVELVIKKNKDIDITRHWGDRYTSEPIRVEANKAIFLIKGSLLDNKEEFGELEFIIASDEIKPRSIKLQVERGKVTYLKTIVVTK